MKPIRLRPALLGLAALLCLAAAGPSNAEAPLARSLRGRPYKIAYECYVDGNWEIFTSNADGSRARNLTRTPDVHEHYPQISPDGRNLAYCVDTGEGREAVRSLWVRSMPSGTPRKIADHAREPFWSPDGRTLGYLPQEYPKFDVIDFYTKGMMFYDMRSGKTRPHPNSAKIHHLYNPGMSPNGKWIVATVHGGTMGFGHAILLIEADGARIINLNIPGCRPTLSRDGKQITWGASDNEVAVAPLDTDAETPAVGVWTLHIKDEKNKIYHSDFSPDGRYVALSRGPDSEGDATKKVSFQAAAEVCGVYAKGWDIYAVSAKRKGILNLETAGPEDFAKLTTNGDSNKEAAWYRIR